MPQPGFELVSESCNSLRDLNSGRSTDWATAAAARVNVLIKPTFRDVTVADDGVETLQAERHVRWDVGDDADVTDVGDQATHDLGILRRKQPKEWFWD